LQLFPAAWALAALFPLGVSFPPFFIDLFPVLFQEALLAQAVRLSRVFGGLRRGRSLRGFSGG